MAIRQFFLPLAGDLGPRTPNCFDGDSFAVVSVSILPLPYSGRSVARIEPCKGWYRGDFPRGFGSALVSFWFRPPPQCGAVARTKLARNQIRSGNPVRRPLPALTGFDKNRLFTRLGLGDFQPWLLVYQRI